jgi:hypothetical protein
MNVARESLQPMPRTLTAAHKRAMDLRPAGTWHGIPIHQPTKASGEAVGPAFYLPSVTVPGIARELRKTGKIGEFNVDRMMEQRRAMQSLSERPSRSPMQINYTRGRSSANMRWEPEMKDLADLSPEARAKWNKVRAHMKKMKGLEDELDRKIRTMPRRTLGI